jgi:hypothetical protein
MKTIKAKAGQNIYDIALENYGTAEAAGEIMMLNEELKNDPRALTALGYNALDMGTDFYLDVALKPGSQVVIDPDNYPVNPNTMRSLENEITTYEY